MAFREAVKVAVVPLALALVAGWFEWLWVAAAFVAALVFVFYFFRDPERADPVAPEAVVAPADGRVMEVAEETLAGRPGNRIGIFLSIWDVHVNRSPIAGEMAKVDYRPGKFHAAMRPKASAENERNVIQLATVRGPVVVEQIAGWVARRVVLWKRTGDRLERGERFGMIRFGSRVELWLPAEASITVRPGDRVRGGSSVVAQWR